jgi:hypothetical protein
MTDVLVLVAAVGLTEASSATLCMALPTVSTEMIWPRLSKRLMGEKMVKAMDSESRGRTRGSTVSKNAGLKIETFSNPVSSSAASVWPLVLGYKKGEDLLDPYSK